MRQGRPSIRVSPTACIMLALAAVILPIDWVISWVLAMLTHEICHIVALIGCGSCVLHIRISHAGAQIETDSLSPVRQIICALAGPMGGFLLLFLVRWFPKLAICAVVQSAFNLLPLSIMDGGRIIHGFLRLYLADRKTDIVCIHIDRITKIIICVLSIYLSIVMSWGMLAIVACVVLIRRNRLKTPCKQALQRVQ